MRTAPRGVSRPVDSAPRLDDALTAALAEVPFARPVPAYRPPAAAQSGSSPDR